MKYRIALDTFHFGFKCNFSDVDNILDKIKNYLFFKVVPEKSKNPFYCFGWQYPQVGFNCFFDVKSGLANCPISFELNGRFFRMAEFSTRFVDFILKEFRELIYPQRCDACIDVIYESCNELEAAKEFPNFSKGFPVPAFNKDFKYKVGSFEGHFDVVGDHVLVDLISSGRGEKKLRVYDKDKDLLSKDKLTYSEVYGLLSYRAFRCEYAVRSDSIKAFFDRYTMSCYNDVLYFLVCAMFQRFSFYNVNLDDVFDTDISFYKGQRDSFIDSQIADCLNKLRVETNRYCVLNEKKYKEKCSELGAAVSSLDYLKQLDFYEAYETLNKEGIY